MATGCQNGPIMNPHPATGSTYRPLSNSLSDSVPSRTVLHNGRVMIEPRTQYPIIDLTGNDDEKSEIDRPAKRQKLDTTPVPSPNLRIGPPGIASALIDRYNTPLDNQRPVWSFLDQGFKTEIHDGFEIGDRSGGIQRANLGNLPPLPTRPWKYAPPINDQYGIDLSDESGLFKVQTSPYTLDIPTAAPKLDDNQISDFYPWTGSHPEDSLTEQTAKQGFYDRVQVSQNESNTARPSLYSQFKHRSGLKVLSFVFSAALEKRRAHCTVSQPSTFKPPPRVTLTDNKREAWLRDLASSLVPLRRLSRTIPHGIRGKILLDQCLGKNIPIGRAIWLAKCVGANEIRAFRRKGTTAAVASGLESKWIRDWTLNVQQFLEAVVGNHAELDWSSKLAYAMRLSARIFLENLLDQDLFLDWFLSSLSMSSLDKLPVWLSMMGVYWSNLVRYRKRGRRLAETLLEKLTTALPNESSILFKPLIDRLQNLIRSFVKSHPSCFILPFTWRKYEASLLSCFPKDKRADYDAILARLSEGNARVTETSNDHSSPKRSSSQQLIHLLDSTCSSNDVSILSSECLKLPLLHSTLVSKVLEWTSTSFRHGTARIYVAVRLLRRWRKWNDIDTDNHILSFLVQKGQHPSFKLTCIYHVISELVRSQSFSVGKYLQWLMARGAVSPSDSFNNYFAADVHLLSHIPSRRLPEHVWNLRNTLLRRAGVSINAEVEKVNHIKSLLQRRLPGIFAGTSPDDDVDMVDIDFSNLTWTVKSEISQWMREHITIHLTNNLSRRISTQTVDHSGSPSFTPNEFFEIRHILESMEDLSILADILKQTSQSSDVIVLAAAVDTLNYHFDSLSAIGAAADLFKDFAAAYSRVCKLDPRLQYLVISLLDVAVHLPAELSTSAVLRRDLIRLDKKSTLVASSPVSEHMADTLNPINPTFSEMLDQLLASGNSMDDATLIRIFELLVQRLELNKGDISLSSSETAMYLAQLRTFNPKTFDTLMVKRVITILKSSSKQCLTTFLPPLIGVGCITFQAFFNLVKRLISSDEQPSVSSDTIELQLVMLSILNADSSQNGSVPDLVSYRFKIARQDYVLSNPCDIAALIHDTLEKAAQTSSDNNKVDFQGLWATSFLPLLSELIVRRSGIAKSQCVNWVTQKLPAGAHVLRQAIDHLLNPEPRNDQPTALEDMLETIHRIDDFSLPFCLIKMQLLLATQSDYTIRKSILDVVFKAFESDVRNDSSRWIDIVSKLDEEDRREIRQIAENKLLLLFPPSPQQTIPADDCEDNTTLNEAVLVNLRVVEELARTVPGDIASSDVGGALVEKINALFQRSAPHFGNASSTKPDALETHRATDKATIGLWFYALLRLVAIHRLAFSADTVSKADLTDQTRLLISICCMAFTPLFTQGHGGLVPSISVNCIHLRQCLPTTWTSLQGFAIDVAAGLIDTLPDEARHQCARFMRDRCPPFLQPQNDSRILYLFGPIPETQTIPSSVPAGNNAASPNTTITNAPTYLQPSQAQSTSFISTTSVEDPKSPLHNLRFQQGGRVIGLCPPRAWEMLEESAPVLGVNDTALNLSYFGTRRVRTELK